MKKSLHKNRSHLFTLITLFSVLLMASGCAGLKSETENEYSSVDTRTALNELIMEEMNTKNITGLAIAVADSEKVLWSEGFGLADKKEDRQFNNETISNVGSVSKLITATAVMKLVETGKIDLDVPVSTYIPEFNPRGGLPDKTVTVRMLLNHQSGLESDGFQDFFLGYERPDDYTHSYRRAIAAVNQCGIVREPYTIFSYCNLGYSLLGCIVERVQGSDFQKAVKELVFDPAGMTNSSFIQDEIPANRMSVGYTAGKPVALPYIRDMPAGSLNASANDIGLFLQNILSSYRKDTGLLKQETLKEMFEPSNIDVQNDLDFRIGLTWWIVDLKSLPGEYILGHGGDLPPYHAIAAVLPERDLAVFVMVNSVDGVGSFSLTNILSETVRTFAAEKQQAPIQKEQEHSPIIKTPENVKNNLPAFYASSAGLSEIKLKGDKLKIFAFNRWFDLHYHADGTLTLGIKLLGLIPLKLPVFEEISISTEEINNTQSINLRLQGILLSPCTRIEPVFVDQTWMERCGKYTPVQSEIMPQYTGFKLEFDKKSGFLCLFLESSEGWSKFPLQTENATRARLMGIGRSLGGSITVKSENNLETLSFLNFELHRE